MTIGLRRWWADARLSMLPPGDVGIVIGGGAAVVLAVGGFWAFATGADPDTWVPTLLLISLMVLSVPICYRVARSDDRLRRLLLLGLVLKLLAVFPRYYVNEVVYAGEADTGNYHQAGQSVYLHMHEDHSWSMKGAILDDFPDESRTVGYFAGALYLVVGTTYLGGYIIFSWIAWVGLMLAFRAFQVAYPNAPPHLVAALMFFLPSLLYWPSSVGKDAVMMLCLGGITLGISRLVTPNRPFRGLAMLFPFGYLMVQIRPHLLMIVLVAGAASMLARSSGQRRTGVAVASRILVLAALIPGLFIGLGRMDDLFGDANTSAGFTLTEALAHANEQTSIGGSAFETQPVTGPQDLPVAIVSVLYRPFPFEVNSIAVLVSSFEGLILLIGTFVAGRWLWRVGPAALSHPFAAYCAAYVLAFIIAFSNIGNAGILARQRVQMFPILILLVGAARESYRLSRLPTDAGPDRPAAAPAGTPDLLISH